MVAGSSGWRWSGRRRCSGKLLIGWQEAPSAPGHAFYDRLSAVLDETGLDRKVEELWAPHYAALWACLGLWAASLMIRPRPAEWRAMRRHLKSFASGLLVRAACWGLETPRQK